MNSINTEITERMEIVQEIWEELKEIYHQGDIYAIFQGDQKITEYFATLNKTW